MTTAACLHWTLSQSILIVRIGYWNSDGVRDPTLDNVMLGFKHWADLSLVSTKVLFTRSV
jgi:hypothetical protein